MYFTAQLKKSAGSLTFRQIIFAFALLVVFVGQVSADPDHHEEEQKRDLQGGDELIKNFDPSVFKRDASDEQKRDLQGGNELIKDFDPSVFKRDASDEQKRDLQGGNELIKDFDPSVFKRDASDEQKRDLQGG